MLHRSPAAASAPRALPLAPAPSLQLNIHAALAAVAAVAAVAARRRHADAGLALGHSGRALGLEPELALGRS